MGTPSSHNKMGIELAPFLAKRKPPGALFVPFAGGDAPDSDALASRFGHARRSSRLMRLQIGGGRVHLALRRRDKLYSSDEDNGGNSP